MCVWLQAPNATRNWRVSASYRRAAAPAGSNGASPWISQKSFLIPCKHKGKVDYHCEFRSLSWVLEAQKYYWVLFCSLDSQKPPRSSALAFRSTLVCAWDLTYAYWKLLDLYFWLPSSGKIMEAASFLFFGGILAIGSPLATSVAPCQAVSHTGFGQCLFK